MRLAALLRLLYVGEGEPEADFLDHSIDMSGADKVCETIRASCEAGETVAFVSGNFNVVHPGHLRLLKFAAEQADVLVVGVNPDSTPGVTLDQEMRLENVRAISFVHHAVRLDSSATAFISLLQPTIVVKGKEFEDRTNPEQEAVDAYGGRLLFSSGELRFASLSLLERDADVDMSTVRMPLEFTRRHGFDISQLKGLLGKLSGMRVAVIGDLIVDEYVTCEAVGMSQEDPTIVVTPLMTRTFVGGAGAVAAHAHGLGADVSFFTLVGDDESARFARSTLEQHGVNFNPFTDQTRPTTRKQRFRALNKTLLRVNHLRQHAADAEIQRQMLATVERSLKNCDLVLFSCFNYGCLPQDLVDAVADRAREKGVMMTADSQVSSQTGDVSRFKGMTLLTPTEREARVALNDFISGLAVISERLVERARAKHLVITLGAEGGLINTMVDGTFTSDRLPAFNPSPKDVSGAGDSFFMASSMALRAGADVWQSSYLGSLAAALQVSRVGNLPLTTAELVREIDEAGFSHE
jgi:rfaE bifunctional protein kinase chain/domain